MTSAPEIPPKDTGLCWFAMQRLPPLLVAFVKEIDGVRAAEDIEYIHRMRVASRRLRAALPLFRSCFPHKQYARWMKEIAAITRALGEARDTDVQIAFLQKHRKNGVTEGDAKDQPATEGAYPREPAIAYLLQELRQRRREIQLRVLSALDGLEKSGIVGEMRTRFASRAAATRRAPVRYLAYGIPAIAALRISSRLSVMRSFTPWIPHADAVAEHHAMRIAAKKLRYTMEVYGPVYRLGLKKPHAQVKKVQEILGDLHDCDVWIEQVTRLLLRERGILRSQAGKQRPDTETLAGLRLFLQDRERERILLHRRFMGFWNSLERQNLWDELRQTLTTGRKKRFVPARGYREEEAFAVCEARASACPEGFSHSRTVTRIALALFDQLQALHGFSQNDRFLLECAGMLHDTGWPDKQKRHNTRFALRIFADESLPFDIPDRTAISLIAVAHRGRVGIESHPLFPLFSEEQKRSVLGLAALLRVADELDYRHTGSVQEVRCTMNEKDVACEILSPADVTQEKERGRSRSILFARVFGRELVIR